MVYIYQELGSWNYDQHSRSLFVFVCATVTRCTLTKQARRHLGEPQFLLNMQDIDIYCATHNFLLLANFRPEVGKPFCAQEPLGALYRVTNVT